MQVSDVEIRPYPYPYRAMLAICSEIEEWKKKKESQAANAKYNEYLNS